MRPVTALVRLCLILFLALSAITVQAQNVADGTYFEEMGLKPFGAYHGGNFDTVSLSNGNLFVKIPLFSLPQRGSQPVEYALYYNTRHSKTYNHHCNGGPPNAYQTGDACITQIVWQAGAGTGPSAQTTAGVFLRNNLIFGASQQFASFEWVECPQGELDNEFYRCLNASIGYAYKVFHDPTGATHTAAETAYGVWRAFDGSGYFLDASGVIWDVNGRHSSTTDGCAYDPNGNCISTVDTMGRNLPREVTSQDSSLCPTNLRPISKVTAVAVPGQNQFNGVSTYTLCYTHVTVVSSVVLSTQDDPTTQTSSDGNFLQSVVLPNGQTWSFEYFDDTGDLRKITMPLGGSISYTTTQTTIDEADIRGTIGGGSSVLSRTVDPADGSGKTYTTNYSYGAADNSADDGISATVTDPDNNDTVTYSSCGGGSTAMLCARYPYKVEYYQGTGSNRQLLKRVETQYQFTMAPGSQGGDAAGAFPTTVTTTLANGLVSKKVMTYDNSIAFGDPLQDANGGTSFSANFGTASLGKVLTESEYGWGQGAPGALMRKTVNTYQALDNSAYMAANLLNLPSSTAVYDGFGNVMTQKQYKYDEGSVDTQPGSPTQHETLAAGTIRGNLTSVRNWAKNGYVSTTHCAFSDIWAVSHSVYYDTGEVHVSTDPCGNSTTHLYDPAYQGAYETSTTNAKSQTASKLYDFNTGLTTSSTDVNSKTTSYSYADPLNRITHIGLPIGSADFTWGTTSVTITRPTGTSTGTTSDTINVDGLGRKTSVSTKTGTDSNSIFVTSETTYDNKGRVATVTNPHTSSSNKTDGTTQTYYDALDRPVAVVEQDGSVIKTCYDGISASSYPSNCLSASAIAGMTEVDTTDEANSTWRRYSDALGELRQVTEPGGLNTTYGYDGAGNLTGINQIGLSGEVARQRSFTYDTLGNLLSSNNPETGVLSYTYDAMGRIVTKTDANGVHLGYQYDELGRMTQRSADGTNPFTDTYMYDSSAGSGTNLVGRLASDVATISVGSTTSSFTHGYYYDDDGRETQVDYTPPGASAAQSVHTAYDNIGNVTSLTYPSGRVVTPSPTLTGQVLSVTDADGTSYFSNGAYFPTGQMLSATLGYNSQTGQGINEALRFNSRLQPCYSYGHTTVLPDNPIDSTKGNVFDRTASYTSGGTPCEHEVGDAGNIRSISDYVNTNWSQSFTYDTLNRLKTDNRNDGKINQTYNYDSFGNMTVADVNDATSGQYWIDVAQNDTPPATDNCGLNGSLPHNRMYRATDGIHGYAHNVYQYDCVGNLTYTGDGSVGGHQYSYNALGQIVKVDTSTGIYGFDAQDERVFRQANGTTVNTYYFNGQPLSEYDSSSGAWTDYIYANGQRIAKVGGSRQFHFTGTNTASCNQWYSWAYNFDMHSLTVQPGDTLSWMQYQAGTGNPQGGIGILFSDGSYSNGVLTDQNGVPMNALPTQGSWVSRSADLSSKAGLSISASWVDEDYASGAGDWDERFADIALTRKDGTVMTLFNSQDGFAIGQFGQCVSNQAYTVDLMDANTPGNTHYYVDDHLGTTQVELSSGLWPTWKGQFTPFGQELDSGMTAMKFKFTSKERDSETGLDNFGARSYGSGLGRFMSPDWAAKAEPVPYAKLDNPQSFNLYSYVLNRAVSMGDVDGHCGGQDPNSCPAILQGPHSMSYMDFHADPSQTQTGTAGQPMSEGEKIVRAHIAARPVAKGLYVRPDCQANNGHCDYALNDDGHGNWYVYEHQTASGITGTTKVKDGDYVSPGFTANANQSSFTGDELGGSGKLDSYRYFTVSHNPHYVDSEQQVVYIREDGADHAFEHIHHQPDPFAPVEINGNTSNLQENAH